MKTKSKRTYYGFQMGSATWPAEMDIVTTSKPGSGYQVKCRAQNRTEARGKLAQIWHDSCLQAMAKDQSGSTAIDLLIVTVGILSIGALAFTIAGLPALILLKTLAEMLS